LRCWSRDTAPIKRILAEIFRVPPPGRKVTQKMGYTAKLFTISGLAVELDRDRRTIGKALARIPPDGRTASGDDGWYLKTVLAALGRMADGRRGNGHTDDFALDALEHAAAAVDTLLDALRAEPSVKKRRELLRSDGRAIGELTVAFERVRAEQSDSTRLVTGPFVDQMLGNAIAEVLALCDLKLEAA
jgi:hypothetical protein